MLVSPRVFAGPEELGAAAAALITDRLTAAGPGSRFLLGCPGGRSAESTYRHLARRVADLRIDASGLVVVMMDEYVVVEGSRFVVVDPQLPHSCRRFGREQIVGGLLAAQREAGCPPERWVRPGQLWVPDPGDPGGYERRLADAGGVDLFLLASGAGDGHVAFNPPGAPAGSRTRVVALPETTRRDNLVTFPAFGGDLAAVPSHGVTVGVATIREASAEAVMIAHGPDKQEAVRRLAAADRYDPSWPATVLADCRSPHLLVDRAAAGRLSSLPVA